MTAPTVHPSIGDLDGNLRGVRQAVRDSTRAGARLVVLPELATSGYVFASAEEARASALAADDPRLVGICEDIPSGAVAVVGFAELGETGVYSSAAVLDDGGVLVTYRKTHLWGDEPTFFAPGDQRPPVVDSPVGRIGVAICYDLEFPEVPRTLALAGADVIVAPVNWPVVPRPDGERPPEVVLAMASARASRVPIVISDRVGSERGVTWTGGSCIIDHDGWVVDGAPGTPRAAAQTVSAVLDLAAGRSKAIGPRNDVLADRRPELYDELLRLALGG